MEADVGGPPLRGNVRAAREDAEPEEHGAGDDAARRSGRALSRASRHAGAPARRRDGLRLAAIADGIARGATADQGVQPRRRLSHSRRACGATRATDGPRRQRDSLTRITTRWRALAFARALDRISL